jgi:hypothetical protein
VPNVFAVVVLRPYKTVTGVATHACERLGATHPSFRDAFTYETEHLAAPVVKN